MKKIMLVLVLLGVGHHLAGGDLAKKKKIVITNNTSEEKKLTLTYSYPDCQAISPNHHDDCKKNIGKVPKTFTLAQTIKENPKTSNLKRQIGDLERQISDVEAVLKKSRLDFKVSPKINDLKRQIGDLERQIGDLEATHKIVLSESHCPSGVKGTDGSTIKGVRYGRLTEIKHNDAVLKSDPNGISSDFSYKFE
ncbi:hypothetical protein CVU75_02060 [Candidatus Dependentiae bacterium HGW-Dependentiae-1]|nr:MAG: hypothetical protein CVU75_02060 [Candidatus Dependentiae bacterium HGW-Dependentiae-1]